MRISDWSSDVCSSDLPAERDRRAEGPRCGLSARDLAPAGFRLGARLNAKTHACHVPRGDTEQAASPHLLRGRVMADGRARAPRFLSNTEHPRFTEFAHPVRKPRSIALCPGTAGVGKTL